MVNNNNRPIFRFQLVHAGQKNYQHITVGNEPVHLISDVEHFCRWLGFTEDHRRSGLFFDEFIWAEYTKDNARQSPEALQDRIVEYLKNHCHDFCQKFPTLCPSNS